MNDRYLYKAKRKDNGEWIEGNLLYSKKDYYISTEPFQCVNSYSSKYGQSYGFENFVLVDKNTICQCTGLRDKNGELIWENDIVSCEHEKFKNGDAVERYPFSNIIKYKRNYAVEFINTGSSYGYRLRNKSIHFMLTGNVIYNHKIEIIGNIFDNPEIVKQGGVSNGNEI